MEVNNHLKEALELERKSAQMQCEDKKNKSSKKRKKSRFSFFNLFFA